MPPDIMNDYRSGTAARAAPEWVENEARLVNEALDSGVISREDAESGLRAESEVADMLRRLIRVTYFVELPPERCPFQERGKRLLELFRQTVTTPDGEPRELADYLANNRQSVSIALSTLDKPTASALRHLNLKGVPVIGWIVLPDDAGYWTNPTNITETEKRADTVQKWAASNDVSLTAVGFDIEKPLENIRAITQFNVRNIVREERAYRRLKRERAHEGDPSARLEKLMGQLGELGLATEVYTMPRFMKRCLGGMDVNPRSANKYVEMTYTSMLPGNSIGLWLNDHAIPALGLVNGIEGETPGRDLGKAGKLPKHHTPETLARDMRAVIKKRVNIARREFNLRDLYVFALNDRSVALTVNKSIETAFESAR